MPRFLLKTEGQRTDYTGDVLTDTEVAFRTRDIREGLFIKGLTSGAQAQILAHEGALDSSGNEIDRIEKFGLNAKNSIYVKHFIERLLVEYPKERSG